MRRIGLRTLGFRVARAFFHRVLIPLSIRSGPLEPVARRMFLLLPDYPPTMEGLPCPIHVNGLRLWYDTDRPSVTIRGLAAGVYEQPIADLFAATLRPGMTVLDVGAHIGYFSLMAAKHVGPAGRVWSFEPDPANRASLERNIDANGMADRVLVVPLAVTSAVGESALFRSANDTGSSTLYPCSDTDGERIAVVTTSLDAWAGSKDWPPFDLVKVDAEGSDGAVLAGMTELVKHNSNIVVVVELQADAIEAAGEDPIDFLTRLMNSGHVELLDDRRGRIVSQRDAAELVRRSRWSPLNLAMRNLALPGSEIPQ